MQFYEKQFLQIFKIAHLEFKLFIPLFETKTIFLE